MYQNTITSIAKVVGVSIIVLAVIGTSSLSAAGIKTTTIENIIGKTTISGINFPAWASARVGAQYYEEWTEYEINASFKKLPTTPEGYFYEGWLVNKDTGDVISAGKNRRVSTTKPSGKKIKTANSDKLDVVLTWDYRDYDHYVLTLEKDDGNPAPSDYKIFAGDYKTKTIRGMARGQFNVSTAPVFNKTKKTNTIAKAPKTVSSQKVRVKNNIEEKKTEKQIKRITRSLTAQQSFLEDRLLKFDTPRLQKIQDNLWTIKARFSGQTEILSVIDDIEFVISELLQVREEDKSDSVDDILNQIFQ